MKKILSTLLLVAIASVTALAQGKGAQFSFKDKGDVHDFGTVKEGGDAVHVFEFKNTGDKPLMIQNAEGSCGCTTPEWPKTPILPGKSSSITVKYDTRNRVGPISKSVYIKSNATNGGERYELKIKGEVVAK